MTIHRAPTRTTDGAIVKRTLKYSQILREQLASLQAELERSVQPFQRSASPDSAFGPAESVRCTGMHPNAPVCNTGLVSAGVSDAHEFCWSGSGSQPTESSSVVSHFRKLGEVGVAPLSAQESTRNHIGCDHGCALRRLRCGVLPDLGDLADRQERPPAVERARPLIGTAGRA